MRCISAISVAHGYSTYFFQCLDGGGNRFSIALLQFYHDGSAGNIKFEPILLIAFQCWRGAAQILLSGTNYAHTSSAPSREVLSVPLITKFVLFCAEAQDMNTHWTPTMPCFTDFKIST